MTSSEVMALSTYTICNLYVKIHSGIIDITKRKRSRSVMSMRLPKGNMSILDFQNQFDTEEKCRKFFIRLCYPDGFVCLHCGGTDCREIRTRNLLRCKSCCKQISVISGTVFHGSYLSPKQIIWTMYLFANDKRGCSAVQLQRMLKVNYDTAYFILIISLKENSAILHQWDCCFMFIFPYIQTSQSDKYAPFLSRHS